MLALKNKVKEEGHLYIDGRFTEEIGTKACLQGPMDYAKRTKLQLRVRGPVRKKRRYTSSSQEEEEEDAQIDAPLWQRKRRLEFTSWENVKYTKRSGVCWRRS